MMRNTLAKAFHIFKRIELNRFFEVRLGFDPLRAVPHTRIKVLVAALLFIGNSGNFIFLHILDGLKGTISKHDVSRFIVEMYGSF